MSDTEPVSGFVPAIVKDNLDPRGLHRVRVSLPGLIDEAPYWVWPAVQPGASSGTGGAGEVRGSCYPPPAVGSMVNVIFAHGVWDEPGSHAIYFPGHYTLNGTTQLPEGPESVFGQTDAVKRRQRICIWEDADFEIYMVEEAGQERKLVLGTASGLTKIEIVRGAGVSGTGEIVRIEARAGIKIAAKGLVDISSDIGVQIQGRRVARGGITSGTI